MKALLLVLAYVTFAKDSPRTNAIAEAREDIETSNLPGPVKAAAWRNIDKGNFTTTTAGSGRAKNSSSKNTAAIKIAGEFMKFDPVKKRKTAEEFNLDWILSTEFEEDMPMGNVMASRLDSVISLTLVGLGDAVTPVLPKFVSWLKIAIAQKEDFGDSPSFHQRNLNWALGMYSWMLDRTTPLDVWEQARVFDLAAVEEGAFGHKGIATDRLGDYMAFCLQSGKYAEGIAEFEKYHGKREFSANKTLKPREFGYRQCLAHIDNHANPFPTNEVGHKMLQANLEDWLSYGAYCRAATWLKIVNWDTGEKSHPVDVILSAYEDMPNTARPDFI